MFKWQMWWIVNELCTRSNCGGQIGTSDKCGGKLLCKL